MIFTSESYLDLCISSYKKRAIKVKKGILLHWDDWRTSFPIADPFVAVNLDYLLANASIENAYKSIMMAKINVEKKPKTYFINFLFSDKFYDCKKEDYIMMNWFREGFHSACSLIDLAKTIEQATWFNAGYHCHACVSGVLN